MKHATADTLASIDRLLDRLRSIEKLKEKKTGIFYYKSAAFLHFHEDGEEIYADVKLTPPVFERLQVTRVPQQDVLVELVRNTVT